MTVRFAAEYNLPPKPVRIAWHRFRTERQGAQWLERRRDASEEIQGLEDDGCFSGSEISQAGEKKRIAQANLDVVSERKAAHIEWLQEQGLYLESAPSAKTSLMRQVHEFDREVRKRARRIYKPWRRCLKKLLHKLA